MPGPHGFVRVMSIPITPQPRSLDMPRPIDYPSGGAWRRSRYGVSGRPAHQPLGRVACAGTVPSTNGSGSRHPARMGHASSYGNRSKKEFFLRRRIASLRGLEAPRPPRNAPCPRCGNERVLYGMKYPRRLSMRLVDGQKRGRSRCGTSPCHQTVTGGRGAAPPTRYRSASLGAPTERPARPTFLCDREPERDEPQEAPRRRRRFKAAGGVTSVVRHWQRRQWPNALPAYGSRACPMSLAMPVQRHR
jgi:hypothetical protein